MRRFQVILIVYSQLWPITSVISLLMWVLAGHPSLHSDKFVAFLTAFIWLRTICQFLIWYLFRSLNRNGFIFYHHFGLSETQIAVVIYLLDLKFFALWIILISLLN